MTSVSACLNAPISAGWLRVSVGTPAEMGAFRQALTEVMEDPQ